MEYDMTERRILDAMIRYNGSDLRRINHAIKVWGYACAIAEREAAGGNCDERTRTIVSYAAILHDIGIHEAERKHGSSAGNFQELEGPAVAKGVLEGIQLDADILDRVLYLIGNHHSYAKIDGTDFRILVEADFIVNIDEDGMDGKAVAAAKERIFRTTGGTALLDVLYGAR
jgi:hypothetical protein